MSERDTTLDALRGLVMMYMVCVIHVAYWLAPVAEPLKSALLFEMPAVFFIAGAAQSLGRGASQPLAAHVAGRARRVLLPFFLFLPVLFLWLAVVSFAEPEGSRFRIDLGSFTLADVVKILLTCGSGKIPFYQYTWFITCYFVLLCSFPLQARLQRRVGRGAYAAACLALVAVGEWLLPDFHQKYWVMNLLVYNFFFFAGYLYYRRASLRLVVAVAAVAVPLAVAGFATGMAVPMQQHKFPPDLYFVAFGMAWLSVLCLLLWRVKLPCRGLLALWNTCGYTIYLYQLFFAYAVWHITHQWVGSLPSPSLRFAAVALPMLVAGTLLGRAAWGWERFAAGLLSRRSGAQPSGGRQA